MEGQDHDLLVRIDERVSQIHSWIAETDLKNDKFDKRLNCVERSQAKAMGAASVITAVVMVGLQKIMALIFGR